MTSFPALRREPLVSVITPAFDAQALLPDAVSSLLGQSYGNWELILVSDDGRDYCCLLPFDARIRPCFSRRYASGPGAARNVGLRHARGELVAHLDADDLFHPERLESLVPPALEHGMAFDNMRIVDFEEDVQISVLFDPFREKLDFDDALELNHPVFPVCRKSLLSEWDEDISFAEDVLFNLRVISRIPFAPVVNRALMDYRVRPGSISCSEESGRHADEAYAAILKKLETSSLGFCPSRMASVRRMFERKARLNRAFSKLEGGLGAKSFAEYASTPQARQLVPSS